MAEKKLQVSNNPFMARINAPAKSDFDKFYFDYEYKEIYRKAGVDSDGVEFGVPEIKVIEHKNDISEFLESQRDSVGIENYMRAMAVQGVDPDSFKTMVKSDIQDFSDMPDTLADVMLAGDNAKAAFEKLDPALRGSHTTIEGFLNSLSQDKIDNYIKGKVEAAFPVENKGD